MPPHTMMDGGNFCVWTKTRWPLFTHHITGESGEVEKRDSSENRTLDQSRSALFRQKERRAAICLSVRRGAWLSALYLKLRSCRILLTVFRLVPRILERSASETWPSSNVDSSTSRLRSGSFLMFFFPGFGKGIGFLSTIAFRIRLIKAAPHPNTHFISTIDILLSFLVRW